MIAGDVCHHSSYRVRKIVILPLKIQANLLLYDESLTGTNWKFNATCVFVCWKVILFLNNREILTDAQLLNHVSGIQFATNIKQVQMSWDIVSYLWMENNSIFKLKYFFLVPHFNAYNDLNFSADQRDMTKVTFSQC